MANRNIDERIRKPRRAKGTPFFVQRNFYSLGVILFGGLSWYLYELWPETRKLKTSLQEGKFDFSPEFREHIAQMRVSIQEPGLDAVLEKIRQKKEANEEESPKTQSWFSKYITSTPDL